MTARADIDRLMIAAADGDRSALGPLFAALWPISLRYATRMLGDAVLAEDVAQDALVKLFDQLSAFERDRDGLTWTLAIVTWECRTARRSRLRRGPTREATEQVLDRVELFDGQRDAEDRDQMRAAIAALDELSPADRDVIVATLTDDDELRRSLTPATFRKRLERALSRLRDLWRSRHA